MRAEGLYQALLDTPVEIRIGALMVAKPLLLVSHVPFARPGCHLKFARCSSARYSATAPLREARRVRGDPAPGQLSRERARDKPGAPARHPSRHAHQGAQDLIQGEATPRGLNDGVVTYESAHIDRRGFGKIVRSSHSTPGNPETILEIERILREHMGQR